MYCMPRGLVTKHAPPPRNDASRVGKHRLMPRRCGKEPDILTIIRQLAKAARYVTQNPKAGEQTAERSAMASARSPSSGGTT